MENKQKRERSLKDFIDILLPKLWILALVSILCAAAMFIYSYTRQDTYTSSAKFLVKNASTKDTSDSLYSNEIAINKIKNYAVVFGGREFRETVVEEAKTQGLNITEGQLKSLLSISVSSDTPVFTIHLTYIDPDTASHLASVVKECIKDKVKEMERNDGLVVDIDPPSQPEVPNSKNEVRNALIGFILGFALTAGAILVFAFADVTVRDKKKLDDNFDIPILGVIPFHDVDRDVRYGAYGGYKNR